MELPYWSHIRIFVTARGNLVVKRQPLIPRILSVSEAAAIARKPFKPPCGKGYRDHNEELARRLLARKRFVPWGSGQPLTTISNLIPQLSVSTTEEDTSEKREELPPGVEPLILWHSEESDKENCNNSTMIEVDLLLVRYLRPHQRYFQ
jgi:DNA repair and recombination protein RAD54 and RAD54-like protein